MEPFVWNNRFNDIDQLGEALRSWDVNYSQLDPGSFKGMLRLFGREGFEITPDAAGSRLYDERRGGHHRPRRCV